MAIKQKPLGDGMVKQPGGDWQYIPKPPPQIEPDC